MIAIFVRLCGFLRKNESQVAHIPQWTDSASQLLRHSAMTLRGRELRSAVRGCTRYATHYGSRVLW